MAYQKLQPERCALVTPSDSANIPPITGGDNNVGCVLYVGTTGDLKVTTFGGDVVTFKNFPVGFLPLNVLRVWATGTTASDILACW